MTSGAYLRPLVESDLPALHRWYQQPELSEHLVRSVAPRRADEAIAYMRRWLEDGSSEIRRAIVDGDDTPIGLAALTDIDDVARSAELHMFIGDETRRGSGRGRAAIEHLVAEGFGRLGLERIELHVLARNARARALYEATGFVVEGVRRNAARKHGEPLDVVMMALLAPDWRNRVA